MCYFILSTLHLNLWTTCSSQNLSTAVCWCCHTDLWNGSVRPAPLSPHYGVGDTNGRPFHLYPFLLRTTTAQLPSPFFQKSKSAKFRPTSIRCEVACLGYGRI
ncbi:hypothetical protein AVEN_49191-1 [Araneus ventricosus]|uniref:Secreted protein n=1 Tax=Araneus ventricosus TaxID=182803 RepID=A0A4Y2URS8_ARAVE|nr:hypothetical protein AVEN_49191-1 [Araneus ventricosus]